MFGNIRQNTNFFELHNIISNKVAFILNKDYFRQNIHVYIHLKLTLAHLLENAIWHDYYYYYYYFGLNYLIQ